MRTRTSVGPRAGRGTAVFRRVVVKGELVVEGCTQAVAVVGSVIAMNGWREFVLRSGRMGGFYDAAAERAVDS
jgi:hypothetical protein